MPFWGGASGVDQVIASVKCNAAHFGVLDLESTDFGVHRLAFRALIDSKLCITGELWRSVQCSAIVGKVRAVLKSGLQGTWVVRCAGGGSAQTGMSEVQARLNRSNRLCLNRSNRL